MSNKIQFVGFDLETSGSNMKMGAQVIQIGIAIERGSSINTFSAFVDWDWDDPANTWSAPAEKVHNITRERLSRLGVTPYEADFAAAGWLKDHLSPAALAKSLNAWSVGWNVAGFDMPFIREKFPQLSALLGYRTNDLNAACVTLGGKRHWQSVKKAVKNKSADYLQSGRVKSKFEGQAELWHAADYDAAAAVVSANLLEHALTASLGPEYHKMILEHLR